MQDRRVIIDVTQQRLDVVENDAVIFTASISTAANGVGEQQGSECTPRGKHIIRAKIGVGCAENTVFVGRRVTGEIFSESLREKQPERDWILTRILWLSGCEKGINRLGNVDTMQRYIYIHGCPDNTPMEKPGSHGCIRMLNHEVIELFDLVPIGVSVDIKE